MAQNILRVEKLKVTRDSLEISPHKKHKWVAFKSLYISRVQCCRHLSHFVR
jgi:hypothetical protein